MLPATAAAFVSGEHASVVNGTRAIGGVDRLDDVARRARRWRRPAEVRVAGRYWPADAAGRVDDERRARAVGVR